MDDFAKEVITKMETYEKKEKRQFNKYDMAIGLFYGVGIFGPSFKSVDSPFRPVVKVVALIAA